MWKSRYMTLVFICAISMSLAGSLLSMSRPVTRQPESDTKENPNVMSDVLGDWFPEDLEEDEKAEWDKGQPPGWSRGKKTGWGGRNMPPGLAKKQVGVRATEEHPPDWGTWRKEQQESWQEKLEKIRERIRRNTGRNDRETMLYSAEAAARKGVPLQHLEGVTNTFLNRKLSADEYEKTTRAVASGVGKNIDFRHLGDIVNTNVERGVRGNQLAIEIYKEIAARSNK